MTFVYDISDVLWLAFIAVLLVRLALELILRVIEKIRDRRLK